MHWRTRTGRPNIVPAWRLAGMSITSSRRGPKTIAVVAVVPSIALLAFLFTTGAAFAQSEPRYVRFQGVPSSVKGAFYVPDRAQSPPHVGILVIHRTSN